MKVDRVLNAELNAARCRRKAIESKNLKCKKMLIELAIQWEQTAWDMVLMERQIKRLRAQHK